MPKLPSTLADAFDDAGFVKRRGNIFVCQETEEFRLFATPEVQPKSAVSAVITFPGLVNLRVQPIFEELLPPKMKRNLSSRSHIPIGAELVRGRRASTHILDRQDLHSDPNACAEHVSRVCVTLDAMRSACDTLPKLLDVAERHSLSDIGDTLVHLAILHVLGEHSEADVLLERWIEYTDSRIQAHARRAPEVAEEYVAEVAHVTDTLRRLRATGG